MNDERVPAVSDELRTVAADAFGAERVVRSAVRSAGDFPDRNVMLGISEANVRRALAAIV